MKISEAKKLIGLRCCAHSCTNKPAPKKGGLCSTHYSRKVKERDPVYDRYKNFKGNALRRGKEFTITLPEFRQFCIDNNYIISKWRRGRLCTIDRKDNRFGYHIWNIQILTMAANLRKYYDYDRHQPTSYSTDCPF